MTAPARVLLLGLDAADHDLVQRLIRDGRMPNLAALAARGTTVRLRSPATLYAGAVWPTFYTGRPVAAHGVYNNKQWRPELMRVEVPRLAWTGATPFWEHLPGVPSLIVDVPMVVGETSRLDGAYLAGWGTHDLICRGSRPASLWSEIERKFGAPAMPREEFGRPTAASLSRLRTALARATEQLTGIALDLLERRDWRFACVVFGGVHRGGHYLWDRSQVEPGARAARPGELPTDELIELYARADAAVGRIMEHAPAGTLVAAFAVHGMGPNPGWSDLLPEILRRLDEHRTGRSPKRGLLYRLRQQVPHHWQRRVLDLLPMSAAQRLVPLWSRRMFDWSRTRWFPLPMDETGYFRVNLRGRERGGIVAEREYDATLAEVEEIVAGLRDEATGAPIAGPGVRAWRDAGAEAPCRALLPDLIIPLTGPPSSATRRLVSATLPGFCYDVPPRLPSGRSGNHRGHGWLIAAGPGAAAGATLGDCDVLDLLPTVRACLGLPPDPELPGRPIAEVAGA